MGIVVTEREAPVKPRRIQVKIAIPFVGEISGEWEPDEAERNAASG
ncbi:hypothetical protein [Streptomyces collinus]